MIFLKFSTQTRPAVADPVVNMGKMFSPYGRRRGVDIFFQWIIFHRFKSEFIDPPHPSFSVKYNVTEVKKRFSYDKTRIVIPRYIRSDDDIWYQHKLHCMNVECMLINI